MSTSQAAAAVAGTIEECVDDLDDFLSSLDRYSHTVLAAAMRAHLASLLRALVMHGKCDEQEVSAFLAELERDALRPAGV
jgi:hypothetical protein